MLVWDLFLCAQIESTIRQRASGGACYDPFIARGQVLNLPKIVRNCCAAGLFLCLFITGCMPPKNAVKLGSGLSVPEDTIRQLERQEGLSRSEALEVLRYQMQSLEENSPSSSQGPQDSGE